MNIKTSKEEIVYQIADKIEGYDAIIDFAYSGGEGDELEFEWAHADEDANPHLTKEELRIVNKVLECGREEEYVQLLVGLYKDTAIRFDVGEYKYNPLSTLYNVNAK
jgi:hypothetical protein